MHNRHNIATETRWLEAATTQTKPASAGWENDGFIGFCYRNPAVGNRDYTVNL